MERRWEIKTHSDFKSEAEMEISREIESQIHSAGVVSDTPRLSLYEKAIVAREKEKNRRVDRERKEKKELKRLFHPSLNEKSKKLQPRYEQKPIETSLLQWGSSRKQRLQELQSSFSQAALMDCSFSPEIDLHSSQLVPKASQPRYLSLFKLHEHLKNKRFTAQNQSKPSFHPHIFAQKSHFETKDEFLQRLHQSKSRAGGKKDVSKDVSETQIETNETDNKETRHKGPPAYLHLYTLPAKAVSPPPTRSNAELVDLNSRKIADKRVNEWIQTVFERFSEKKWMELEPEKRKIMRNVMKEIENCEEMWNFENFAEKMSKFYHKLPISDRNLLLKPSKSPSIPTSKPLKKSNSDTFNRLRNRKMSEVK